MKRLLLPVLGALGFVLPAHADPFPASERTVILVSIDGFPAWMWNDANTPVPHLRQLAAEGAAAEAMTVSNPSVTWINHTTLVTGVSPRRHGVLFNGLLVRDANGMPGIEQWRDKAELVHVPTLYDAAHAAGLKTAEVDWVAILNSGTIDYEFLERPTAGGAIEKELIASGRVPADAIQRFSKGGANIAYRDMVWTQAAALILAEHHPNLLLFHLLTTDASNHTYGPGSLASYTAYGYVDAQIGELMRTVEAAGMKDKVTWIVATDHGFKKVRRVIDINGILAQAGLTAAHAIPQGGIAFVYATDAAHKGEIIAKIKETCAGVEGIDQVLDGSEGPKFGMPTPAENPGMGDVILYPKDGYAFQKGVTPEMIQDSKTYLGTHGYPASDPELEGIFFASGYGIKKGVNLGKITNLDVAPTAARLLGLTLPDIEGHPLEAALK